MKDIFWGLIFVFIDLNINLSGLSFDFIPDFIGFCMVLAGAAKLAVYSENFAKAKQCSFYLVGLSLVHVAFGLGIGYIFIVSDILAAIDLFLVLYLMNYIVKGIYDLERAIGLNLGAASLNDTFKIYSFLYVLTVILARIILWKFDWWLVSLCAGLAFIAAFVMQISILVKMKKATDIYEGASQDNMSVEPDRWGLEGALNITDDTDT